VFDCVYLLNNLETQRYGHYENKKKCRYDVTSSRVRVTNAAVEKHEELRIMNVCVYFRRSCTSRKSHIFRAALYRNRWPARLYSIFPQYLINGTIFGKRY
jgi:hypothetical protein